MTGFPRHPFRSNPRLPALALALGAAALPALAQDAAGPVAAPAAPRHVTLLGIPSATVAPHGIGFVSLSGTTRRDDTDGDEDGSLALGFGLGRAEESIGLQTTLFVTSLTDDFADSGYLSLEASRRVMVTTPAYVSLALDQIAPWGDSEDLDVAATLTFTAFPTVSLGGAAYPLMVSVGGGSQIRDGGEAEGVFVGAGIGLSPTFGASAGWYGDQVNLGASLLLPAVPNLNLTAVVEDAFDQEDRQRLTVTANWIFRAFGG